MMPTDLNDYEKIWVLKNPTENSKTALTPIRVMNTFYTQCEEQDSMYDGSYPHSSSIVEYEVVDGGYLVVPYKYRVADEFYGFYEFGTSAQLKDWIKTNTDKSKWLIETNPEWFI